MPEQAEGLQPILDQALAGNRAQPGVIQNQFLGKCNNKILSYLEYELRVLFSNAENSPCKGFPGSTL